MLVTPAQADQQNPGMALRALSQSQFDTGRVLSVCRLQTPACDASTTKAYVRREGNDGFVYLIDASKPMLVRVKRQAPQAVGVSWNFAGHMPTFQTLDWLNPSDPEPAPNKPEIYPALYQIDAHQTAIALIQTKHFMYSGGGGVNVAADFLELSNSVSPSGSFDFKPLYLGVPFSSSQLSRSCFTDKEHADLKHGRRLSCHDERSAYLTIRFAPTQTASGPWLFNWHSLFLSSLSDKAHVKKQTPFDLKDGEDLQTKRHRLAMYFVNR